MMRDTIKEYAQESWARNKMRHESYNDKLTEEQHQALAELCADRHYMHMEALDDIWSEDSEHTRTASLVGGIMNQSSINEYLREADLPEINLINYDDCDNVAIYDIFCDTDEEREEAQMNAQSKISDIKERNDQLIIDYLKSIDAKYGSNYTPSGLSRRV